MSSGNRSQIPNECIWAETVDTGPEIISGPTEKDIYRMKPVAGVDIEFQKRMLEFEMMKFEEERRIREEEREKRRRREEEEREERRRRDELERQKFEMECRKEEEERRKTTERRRGKRRKTYKR